MQCSKFAWIPSSQYLFEQTKQRVDHCGVFPGHQAWTIAGRNHATLYETRPHQGEDGQPEQAPYALFTG